MRYWEHVAETFNQDGVETLTNKLTIVDGEKCGHDFYVKVGWWRGRPVWIDITKARHSTEGIGDTENIHGDELLVVVELRRRLMDVTRTSLELICREASLLLTSRRSTLDDMAQLWRVTTMEPKGRCSQVADELGDRVTGPLDAVAKLIKLRGGEWEAKMAHTYTEDQIELMLENCQAAVEERRDDFTAWELKFIEEVEDANQTLHLTENQIEKLEQIWEERGCG